MAVLFDSGGLSPSHSDEALTALFAQGGLPIRVSHVRPSAAGRTVVEHWSFDEQSLFVARGNTLRLARSRGELKACAPEGIRLGYQLTGSYRLQAGEHREANSAGQLNVTDLTQPCEFTQYGPDAAVASLELSWDDLGLSAETVRRSAPFLRHSPAYSLMQAHMARLCADADSLRSPDVGSQVGHATLHLARALIASADAAEPHVRAILNEALYSRIAEYVLLHLAEPSLTPDRIAAAHHISLRTLYRVWSHTEKGVAEWIIGERLARAAAALADDRQRRRPISAIAFSLGFQDAAHFSRRFRAAYGVAPHLWRQQSGHEPAGLPPMPGRDTVPRPT
ncbi:MAG: AraC family transcriptional regulator [Actinomycetia bacterium]|nr:AraC family transcriptional regulator [Actinomycetes bacterium]